MGNAVQIDHRRRPSEGVSSARKSTKAAPALQKPESNGNPESSLHHYLPITDDLLRDGVHVTGAGRGVSRPGESYPPEKHPPLYFMKWDQGRTLPGFSVMFISGGQGDFETTKTGRLRLEAGSVAVLFPGIWHRYRPDPKVGWIEKWVHFNGPLAHQLVQQGVVSPARPILRPLDFKSIEAAMDRLIEAVRCEPSCNSLYVSLKLLGVIAGLCDKPPGEASSKPTAFTRADSVVAAAIDYIWTRSNKALSVSDVAHSIGLTRRTVERHMKACRGHGVLDEIVRCRFSRAELLLRETELPIKNIVHLAGFGSVQNMRTVFLTRTTHAPGDYRARFRTPISL